jgi:PAS domain S-box-containing protein
MRHTIIERDFIFQKIFENSHSGIALLDGKFNVVYRSTSTKRISGWGIGQQMGGSIMALIHPNYQKEVEETLKEILTVPGLSKTCAFMSRHSKGHYIWLECTFTNMLHEDKIEAIVCNFIEITDKREADKALQKTVNELYAYQYALDESAIVAITDQKGIIKHVNDNFCKISKYSAEELIGHDHRIINSSHHPKSFIKNLWHTIANGKIWRGQLKNKAKDGQYYWVDTTIVPFLNEHGKPYQYIAIRSDITARKLHEEQLTNYIKAIEEQNEKLSEISWIQSHVIRAPLAKIMGLIPLLQDLTGDDGDKKQIFNFLQSAADELDAVIKGITDITKISDY